MIAMPGVSFGRGKSAAGVDRGYIGDLRECDIGKRQSGGEEGRQGMLEGVCNRGIEIVEEVIAGDAGTEGAEVGGGKVGGFFSGQNGVEGSAEADGGSEHPDGIQRGGEWENAVERHAILSGLEAGNTAQCGRDADAAASIGADGGDAHSIGDGYRRARGGATRNSTRGAIERVGWGAVVGIDADARKGEFRHVGPADEYGAGALQTADYSGITGRGRSVAEGGGCRGSDLAFHIEQVFDGDRKARDRGEPARLPIDSVGGPSRAFRIQRKKNAASFAGGSGGALESGIDNCSAGGLCGHGR